ncbi:MAG: hypothetical protein PHN42_03060 [Bacilli bacterium]|nr:hypothetical protein [Bacilli bacterium]
MKILKIIFKYLSNFLIGVLVLFRLYAVAVTTIFKQSYVNVFGYTFFVVATGSMSGTININDAVIVKMTDKVKVNDVITYVNEGYYITHRVVSINGDEIITKGDINSAEDDPIDYSNVIGKVVFVFPFSIIFQVLGALILIFIIIVIFNFEKIFKKFILEKKVPKLQQQEIKKVSKKEIAECNIFIKTVLLIMKDRNERNVNNTDDDWIKNLKYVTKIIELLRVENYEFLQKLVNYYEISSTVNEILPVTAVMQLKDETYSTYVILLLNCITYQDKDLFNILFSCLKYKVNYEIRKGILNDNLPKIIEAKN